MESEFRAVLFDMDGLMLDSERIYYRAQQDAAGQLGYDASHDLMVSFVGLSAEKCEATIVKAADHIFTVEQFHNLWSRLWREYVEHDGMPLKEGLLPLLQWLQDQGVSRSVVTSSLGHEAELALELSDIGSYFSVVVTGDDVVNMKPAPDIYLLAAERIGVEPAQCIALEDSDAGVLAASSARMRTVMIPDLRAPSQEARDKAYAVLPSLNAAFPLIRSWLGFGDKEEPG